MAGKQGMKGGGGARKGAGRPKKAVVPLKIPAAYADPQAFLTAVMNDPQAEPRFRVDAAKALMPFVHPKKGEGGKKEERQDAAKKAASGKFATPPPPLRLAIESEQLDRLKRCMDNSTDNSTRIIRHVDLGAEKVQSSFVDI